ncbi:urease accessory protein UreF [Phytohabitans suffuscus]|uniref:Urease accessory protein UreF n=1 Tax=Phytohabitans suffuscus TaxID=624315 RepID=A0A6F8YSS2_9ACTN|nr:urease accessory UreF family protein [Phytohabitans suffuscus]BCB89033.1 urease accessory protein UreF [Phytohabitans suffuscus]
MPDTTLLLLADGRFPAGGHAHSGGLEAAVTAGRVRDLDGLAGFLRGRLATAGLVSAAFAAAACRGDDLGRLEAELDARTPSPALRKASRAQGRALLRTGRALWTLSTVERELHHPVALGVVAAAAGLTPAEAALTAAYGTVTGPASAAVRLLGLDPYATHALVARLAADCDSVAARATTMDDLPACSAPLLDIGAEAHATWEVRLFAS